LAALPGGPFFLPNPQKRIREAEPQRGQANKAGTLLGRREDGTEEHGSRRKAKDGGDGPGLRLHRCLPPFRCGVAKKASGQVIKVADLEQVHDDGGSADGKQSNYDAGNQRIGGGGPPLLYPCQGLPTDPNLLCEVLL
jgi:hypothetical protein